MSIQSVIRDDEEFSDVSPDFGLGVGKTYRKVVFREYRMSSRKPQTRRLPLRHSRTIFDLTKDGLTQVCLKQLFKDHFTAEVYTEVTTPCTGEFRTGRFSSYAHAIRVYQNAKPPYKVTDVNVSTLRFPVGLRFQPTISQEEENICLDPLLDQDATVRRKFQRLALHMIHDIKRRVVSRPLPYYLRYNLNDLNPTVELLKYAEISIKPDGRCRFMVFADDLSAKDISEWPIRLGEGLPPVEMEDEGQDLSSDESLSDREELDAESEERVVDWRDLL